MPLIEFRGVQKSFGNKKVYRNLNLDLIRGELLTIIGGSGQGKSVMLKMIVGLLPVSAGQIFLEDRPIQNMSEKEYSAVRRRVAMLFQAAALFDSLNTYDNVAYGLRENLKMNEELIKNQVSESLEYVGLAGTERLRPTSLSAGMKKRIALARALAVKPEVILYDEPTTGLDPLNVNRISDLIVYLQKTLSITSVVVTHDLDLAITISDRIAMIHEGEIIFSGIPEELVRSDNPIVKNFIEGKAPLDEDTETLLKSAG